RVSRSARAAGECTAPKYGRADRGRGGAADGAAAAHDQDPHRAAAARGHRFHVDATGWPPARQRAAAAATAGRLPDARVACVDDRVSEPAAGRAGCPEGITRRDRAAAARARRVEWGCLIGGTAAD